MQAEERRLAEEAHARKVAEAKRAHEAAVAAKVRAEKNWVGKNTGGPLKKYLCLFVFQCNIHKEH